MKNIIKKIVIILQYYYYFLKFKKDIKHHNIYRTKILNSFINKGINADIGFKAKGARIIGKVRIGRFVSINPYSILSGEINGINIGDFCSIGRNVSIIENYHNSFRPTTYYFGENIFFKQDDRDIYSKGKIILEEDIWVGNNSVILSGIKIGRGSIIGAGSVVTKDIEPYSVVAGNPAKILKKRFSQEKIDYLEKIKWWKWDIKKILNNYEFFISESFDEIDIK